MKKINQLTFVIIGIYLSLMCVFYFVIIYPVVIKQQRVVKSNIPSLSVEGLKQYDRISNEFGKEFVGYSSRPELSKYIFGQEEPFK